MKKKNLIFVLGIVMLMVFSGCSQEGDKSYTDNFSTFSIQTLKNIKEDSEVLVVPQLIKYMDFEDIISYEILQSKMYLLNLILAGINNGEIEFVDKNKGNQFKNKLKSLTQSFTLSNENNVRGVINNLNSILEFVNNIPKTVNVKDQGIIYLLLAITLMAIEENLTLSFDSIPNNWNEIVEYIYSDDTEGIIIVIIVVTVVTVGAVLAVNALWKGICNINYKKCIEAAAQIADSTSQQRAMDDCKEDYDKCLGK